MVRNAIDSLEHFKKKNGQLPNEIIFMSRNGSISTGETKLKQRFISALRK